MPRRKVPFVNGEYYHIYNRGVDKRNIINSPFDIKRILESLSVFNTTEPVGSLFGYSKRNKNKKVGNRVSNLVEVVAFNILNNHYHLVLKQISDEGVSIFMKSFGGGYTKHYNEKYDRVGPLFQGPFKAEHISSDEYFNYVVAYVNGNHFVHGLESVGNLVSNWGMRSSLEQYVLDEKKWENKYFKCDLSAIKHLYKTGVEYLDEVKEIAKNIRTKRGKNDQLETRFPTDILDLKL